VKINHSSTAFLYSALLVQLQQSEDKYALKYPSSLGFRQSILCKNSLAETTFGTAILV
jgi:hypothetical protein